MGAWKQKLISSWRWWIVFLGFSCLFFQIRAAKENNHCCNIWETKKCLLRTATLNIYCPQTHKHTCPYTRVPIKHVFKSKLLAWNCLNSNISKVSQSVTSWNLSLWPHGTSFCDLMAPLFVTSWYLRLWPHGTSVCDLMVA
jgi:hypothetical protein